MSLRRARLASAALRRSSASCRRLCRPAMPAASSRMRRRCSGLALTISPIWPWRTSAGERAPVAASSNRMRTSRSAHLLAVDAVGRARLALDAARHIERLAAVELGRRLAAACCRGRSSPRRCCARDGRWCRRRSRRPWPRRACSCARSRPSPSAAPRAGWTCRSRSGRPRPVRPFSISSSVGSTNDLKPTRRSRLMCMGRRVLCMRAWTRTDAGQPKAAQRARRRLSPAAAAAPGQDRVHHLADLRRSRSPSSPACRR